MLLRASYSRNSLVGPISGDPQRAAFDNMGREDSVVIGLVEDDIIEGEEKHCDVSIGAVQIRDRDPDTRGASCD